MEFALFLEYERRIRAKSFRDDFHVGVTLTDEVIGWKMAS
jgi:hypothetical protein